MSDWEKLAELINSHKEAAILATMPIDAMRQHPIIVTGAYKGDTIAFLRDIYPDHAIYGYEPQDWAYEICQKRFAGDTKITIHRYGIGAEAGVFDLREYETDAASFVTPPSKAGRAGRGVLIEAGDAFQRAQIRCAALWVMNIEGYEYRLIPHLAQRGTIERVENFVMQWHREIAGLTTQKECAFTLSQTHTCRWQGGNWAWWQHD